MTFNVQDRSANPVSLKTTADGSGNLSGSTVLTDAAGTIQANIAAVAAAANTALPNTGAPNILLAGASPLLLNAAGNWDAVQKGGGDVMSMRGRQAAQLGTYYTATSTTTVSAASTSATISVAATAGFKVGGVCTLEPNAAHQEFAEITAVSTNSSVTLAFPSGGALFTHTANYAIATFAATMQREAPGRAGALLVSSDGTKPTYRSGGTGLTLYSIAAAVLVEIQGSATFTVRVKKITLWGQAGTKYFTELQLLRSTGLSGSGTPVAANLGQHDGNDAAATAVVNSYAAAATYGAGHAVIGALPLSIAAPASGVQGVIPAVWDFSRNQDKALIVRGTGDVIQVYNTITGLGSGTFGFEVEWEEDNS